MEHQDTIGFSSIVNTNPRRTSAKSTPTRDLLPRAGKRARVTEDVVPMTPQSLPATPTQAASGDLASSPLSSPPASEQFFDISNQSTATHPETPLPGSKRGQHGITDITISEGDRRSQPQPGPALLQMVEDAKSRGELAKVYDSSVVRRINGEWMAPQMCSCCQNDPKSQCDRQSPCSSCTKREKVCQNGGWMTKLRSRASKAASQRSTEGTLEAIGNTSGSPLMQSYSGQKPGGSWSSDTRGSQKNLESPGEPSQITITTPPAPSTAADATELDSASPKHQMPCGMKRKAHDDDFSPSHNAEDNSDVMIPPKRPIKKAKAARKVGSVKGRVSTAVQHANNQLSKPESHGSPAVWADKRQQLCETLPYYNAYQSGAYTSEGIAYGLLIDAEVEPRDKFDEQIIITTVGGGRSKDDDNKSVRTTDQAKSSTMTSFMRSKELKLPIAIIAGQGNRISPARLPYYYNVLDWFHITDVWAEKIQGFTAWKVRLEKICLTEKSWWAIKGSPDLTQEGPRSVESQLCSHCAQSSKSIYNAGWTCLNTECMSYFQFPSGYNDSSLDYTEAFLKERSVFQGKPPGPLSKPLLTAHNMAQMDSFGVELEFKRGIVCPKCGCCSRRIAWDHWKCENEKANCDFVYRLEQRPISINDILARTVERDDKPSSKSSAGNIVAENIRCSQSILGNWDVIQYVFPGEDGEDIGFVRHLKANGIINQQVDGPNDLFMQMQAGNFNLRRGAARQPGSPGEILTSHWASNWGAPYKYGVKQPTTSFAEAPAVILKAIKRLTWAGELAVTEGSDSFQPFNECLTIGYFENTHIGYHDDGEKELGDTVATLSLGTKAVMDFRPKAKSSIGGVSVKKGKNSKKPEKPAVLSITLEHGDILVMHGSKIQQYYEHRVTPDGPLRYALTCRYVEPERMADADEIQDAKWKGTLPPGSEQYDYDGDINAVPIVHTASEVGKIISGVAARMKTGDLTAEDVRKINQQLASLLESQGISGTFEGAGEIAMAGAA